MYLGARTFAGLASDHVDLVKRIAYRLHSRLPDCVQMEDLIQAGMLGLLEARERFRSDEGASFTTFAGIRIRGAMLDEIRQKIEDEIERLSRELNVDLPQRIQEAVELGDLRENAEYKSALERQQFVQARIGHLQSRMSELSKIDVEAMPYDRVGFGSRVRVHDTEMDEEKLFTIVAGDFLDLDKGHISLESPMGRGLLGAKAEEEVEIELPMGVRTFKVLDVVTLPQQVGIDKGSLEG